jgi:hypothetical protein
MTLCGDNWLYEEASLKKSGLSANEDKKLQTPADIIPLYARKI